MADTTSLQAFVVDETFATATTNDNLGLTQSKRRGLRINDVQAKYQAACERGNVWAVCSQTGVTSQAGLSATTPVLTVYNPLGSGFNGILWFAGCNLAVVNAAAAAVWLAANTNPAAAAVTGTLTTAHRNCKLGSAANPRALQFLLTATLPAAPVGICLLGMGLTGAITTAPGAVAYQRWFDGSIIIAPGTAISIQTSTASGTSGTWCEYIVEECAV